MDEKYIIPKTVDYIKRNAAAKIPRISSRAPLTSPR
jgi:hypothetical protein